MTEPGALETLAPLAFLDLWTRQMAGRLLALAPNHPALLARARPLFGEAVDDANELNTALATQEAALLAALGRRSDDPLARLSYAFSLSAFELDLLVLSLLPELDERLGDLFAALRGGSSRRPTVGLAARALAGGDLSLYAWLEGCGLWRHGLLRRVDPAVALADRELIPSAAARGGLLGGRPATMAGEHIIELVSPDPLLPHLLRTRPALRALVEELRAWTESVGAGLVHLPSPDPALARLVPEALAQALGRPLLAVTGLGERDGEAVREAVIAAWLDGALLVLSAERETRRLSLPDGIRAPLPIFVLTSSNVEVEVPPGMPSRRLRPPAPRPAEQAALWRHVLDTSAIPVDLLAIQTRLPPATVREAATLARRRVGGAELCAPDLQLALSELVPDPGSGLAELSRPTVAWTDLVLSDRARAALEELRDRVTHRVTVQDDWGLRGPEGRGDGLIALLHGESGTGKTLAAEALCAAFGLPLLRIDLSQVVSKYIGETEKNLGAVFDAAEGFRAVLFFDEADALFGRRTAVKDAHDRYANIETNYLLQRLEAFEGLSLLASNRLQDLDEAFLRRIPFVIGLPRPDRSLQRQLWERNLPERLRDADLDLDVIVRRFDLVGGEIRGAAVSAAYLAAARGGAISQAMVTEAAGREYGKKGRVVAG